jgi:glycosyltransferase involved in cell wall biosynthesis
VTVRADAADMTASRAAGDCLISVVIPTFDRPDYLRTALASVLAQSYQTLEIIVSDNASPQDPAVVIAEFNDPRIRLHRNARNLGITGNVLAGVALATGKYIAILGDDDVWRADFLATLMAPLEADPGIVVAFCDHDIIDADGRVNGARTEEVSRRFGRHLLRDGVYRPFDEIALVYRAICVVSGSLIRRDAIAWSRIPPELPVSVDLYIAHLLAAEGGACAFVARRLMQYRYHSLQSAGSFTNVHTSWRDDLGSTLDLWTAFLRDGRAKSHAYVKMICTRKAVLILVERLRRRQWRDLAGDMAQFLRKGLLDPRAIYYHLYYFQRFQRERTGRLIP